MSRKESALSAKLHRSCYTPNPEYVTLLSMNNVMRSHARMFDAAYYQSFNNQSHLGDSFVLAFYSLGSTLVLSSLPSYQTYLAYPMLFTANHFIKGFQAKPYIPENFQSLRYSLIFLCEVIKYDHLDTCRTAISIQLPVVDIVYDCRLLPNNL